MKPYLLSPVPNLTAFINYFIAQEVREPRTHRLLLGINSTITPEIIQKLKNWGVDEVCISPQKISKEDLEDLAKEGELQERLEIGKTRALLKNLFAEVAADLAIQSGREGRLSGRLSPEMAERLSKAMEIIINKITSNPTARLYIGFMDDQDTYLLRHSANVSHLVLNLVSRYREVRYLLRDPEKGLFRFEAPGRRIDPMDLVPLGISCLLHDIGKVLLLELVNRDVTFQPDDPVWKKIREHPKIGYQILFGKGFDSHALLGIKYHHENMDGTGYPSGIKGYKIHPYSRMIRIADTFDAAISDRPGREKKTQGEILEEMTRLGGKHFDPEILPYFLDLVRNSLVT